MSVTMLDIAQRTGLSRRTVGLALSDKAHLLRPETRRLVVETARAMNYRPNSLAKAMRKGGFGAYALLQSTIANHSNLHPRLLEGFHGAIAERDLSLLFAYLPDEQLTNEGYVPKILRELCADGLLVNYDADIPRRMIELIRGHHIPAVWINSKQEADCVYPDDFHAGREATRRFLEAGHRRIAYVDYSVSSHYSAADRCAGYEAEMAASGLQPRIIRPARRIAGTLQIDDAVAWLRAADRPTAVVAYMPGPGRNVRLAAERIGLRVPRDLSIIAFDHNPSGDDDAPLDSMMIPDAQMARMAVDMLATRIEDPHRSMPAAAVPFGYAKGGTFAPPPEAVSAGAAGR